MTGKIKFLNLLPQKLQKQQPFPSQIAADVEL